ncbi:MAG: hypothetical protein OHK005_19110 [Candidatus Methylacidiphilales bacterium]
MKAAFGLRFVVDLESAMPALEGTYFGNQHLFAGSYPGLGRPHERWGALPPADFHDGGVNVGEVKGGLDGDDASMILKGSA